MKICSIHIKNYQQFEDCFLDFTDPKSGDPLNKICLIGSNGTGKSTILRLLHRFFYKFLAPNETERLGPFGIPFILIKFKVENEFYYFLSSNHLDYPKSNLFFNASVEKYESWKGILDFKSFNNSSIIDFSLRINCLKSFLIIENELVELKKKIVFKNNEKDLVIFSPSETSYNSYIHVSDVPATTVNDALKLFDLMPFHHIVSDSTVQDFWKVLVYHIKKREAEQQEFENQQENLHKTKQQLLEEFEAINPKILNHISILWNRILDKVGLEFDIENAKNPIHLNDNLKAYIKIKETGEQINYEHLSTGIRNYIFRLGHIFSLYFNRKIENGFLLVDEPENSLFPDFIFDLLEIYEDVVKDKAGNTNTQIFMATHNPILAAQFEPYERIILGWEDTGKVKASKGKTPAGDDPNDILKNDFGIRNLMGKKGIEMWKEFLDLKKQLRQLSEEKNGSKEELVDKITEIGSAYNFE